MSDPSNPIGRFAADSEVTPQKRRAWIDQLATLPAAVRSAVSGLSEAQLDTAYRSGGWTVRQVVHHLADGHLNAYLRCRLALTEDNPTIKPWNQTAWGELADARTAPIELSLGILDGVHGRWTRLLDSMSPADFERTFQHPERGQCGLDWLVQIYSWHGRHHVAQITGLRERNGW